MVQSTGFVGQASVRSDGQTDEVGHFLERAARPGEGYTHNSTEEVSLLGQLGQQPLRVVREQLEVLLGPLQLGLPPLCDLGETLLDGVDIAADPLLSRVRQTGHVLAGRGLWPRRGALPGVDEDGGTEMAQAVEDVR